MNTISCKRFRRFEKLEPLTLKDVNFFVGPNNSGKSTVVKAILLLEDNFKKKLGVDPLTKLPMFDLTSQFANVGDFRRACRQTANSDDKNDSFELAWTEKDRSFRITLCDSSIGSMYACYQSIEYNQAEGSLHVFVDFKNREFNYTFGIDDTNKEFDFAALNQIINECKVVERSYIERRLRHFQWQNDHQPNEAIKQHIEALKRKMPEFEIASKDKKKELGVFLDASGIKKLSFVSRQFAFSNDIEDMNCNDFTFEIRNDIFTEIHNTLKEDVELVRELCSKSISVPYCNFVSNGYGLKNPCDYEGFEYLYARHLHQNSVFSILDKNDYTAFAIHEYYNYFLTHKKGRIDFMSCWLKEFEIGTAINIKPMPGGEFYTASIRTMDGIDIPLQDLGMGSMQIVVLLLRLAVISDTLYDIVMIEEPEQNLHPRLQSKLADLFLCVNIMHSATLIVETHSEYIIRRTQYLLAKGSFKLGGYTFHVKDNGINPFQIFYFPSDGQQPYPMEFQESGLFANQFGEGFFDESSNLLLSVLSNARNKE